MNSPNICHLSTVHRRSDTRIFYKELMSLIGIEGALVSLIVADGQGDEIFKGINIHDLGNLRLRRARRLIVGAYRALRLVRRINPDVVHIHDPELLGLAIILKLFRFKVIYDVHEDLPRQLMSKHWIKPALRRPLAFTIDHVEATIARFLDLIVVVTPTIKDRFRSSNTVLIRNFPLLSEFSVPAVGSSHMSHADGSVSNGPPIVAYVGGISNERGVFSMLDAIDIVFKNRAVLLALAGPFVNSAVEASVLDRSDCDSVDYMGVIDRDSVSELLAKSCCGLVVLKPIINYVEAYPVKMFEYMAAGIPVVASDFPIWREIVDEARCGVLVDPDSVNGIADALVWLIENPKASREMGACGRAAVEGKYNWSVEGNRLVESYSRLL